MYVLTCDGHALIIDPVPHISGTETENCIPDGIILTHEHYDHICGVDEWRVKYSCPVYAGSNAEAGLADPRLNMSHYGKAMFEMMFPGDASVLALGDIADYSCKPDHVWNDGEIFRWRGNELYIMHTPGHSQGSICIVLNGRYLFCGDSLLEYLPTGVRWKGGDAKRFRDYTIPLLRSLDSDLTVYPGHGEGFILKDYKFWEQTT